VYQLVKIIREDLIRIFTKMANIPFLPDMDNQKSQFYLFQVDADTDIPLLMKMLATPRSNGQQRVIKLFVYTRQLVMKMLDAIKEVKTQNICLNVHQKIVIYCSGFPQFYPPYATTLLHQLLLLSPSPASQFASKK
jgi:hypothetical protein